MIKVISTIFVFLMVIGCSGEKKDKVETERQKARGEKMFRNITAEDVMLLAVKYDIAEAQLIRILDEYEFMVKGISTTGLMLSAIDKKPGEPKAYLEELRTCAGEIVDVADALNRLSEKYGISKQILSSIIIERRMMEKAVKSD